MNSPPAPHNTRVAVEQAIARGETLDQICDTLAVEPRVVDDVLHGMEVAVAADNARDMPAPAPRGEPQPGQWWPEHRLTPCGTHSAYQRHLRRGEPTDESCLAAERLYQREKRRRLKAMWKRSAAA